MSWPPKESKGRTAEYLKTGPKFGEPGYVAHLDPVEQDPLLPILTVMEEAVEKGMTRVHGPTLLSPRGAEINSGGQGINYLLNQSRDHPDTLAPWAEHLETGALWFSSAKDPNSLLTPEEILKR